MNASDVGRIADLEETTVTGWTNRGVLMAQADGTYAVIDALRFAAVGSLVKAGVPVYRAAEAVAWLEKRREWYLLFRDSAGKVYDRVKEPFTPDGTTPLMRFSDESKEHYYVYVVQYSSSLGIQVFGYAGDPVAADRFIEERLAEPTAGERIGQGEDSAPAYPNAED